jgi:Uma2 family endonuclease
MARLIKHFYTPEEYLATERESPTKNEYHSGEIFAMTGASREHIVIVSNLTILLGNQLESRDCDIYPNDMRVRTPETNTYTYPDLTVVCGQPEFEDDCFDTLLNPTLIVEVLSPSTETRDRTHKFAGYRKITSLQEYLLIAQNECRVTLFTTQKAGPWLFQEATGLGDTLHLTSIDCDLPLDKAYRRVSFPT